MEQQPEQDEHIDEAVEEDGSEVVSSTHLEGEPQLRPKIYVASLSDYNAGRLHGVWLDAAVADEQLWDGINRMLASSPEPGAEEWAIHDYDGFGPLRLGEYENIETVAAIARGIAEHGPAFAHWAAIVETSDRAALDRFADVYAGEYCSAAVYVEELLGALGVLDEFNNAVPELLQSYVSIDFAAFARDMELGDEITVGRGEHGVFVFEGAKCE